MFLHEVKDGVKIFVRLSPKAKREGIEGIYTDTDGSQRLKIAVSAPPVDGKANQELIKLISKITHFPKTSFELVAGLTDRNKTLFLAGNPCVLKDRLMQEITKCLK